MMVGIRFVCCEVCGGLFRNDKTCALHQKWCSGDLSKSSCEYVACDKKLYITHIQSHMSGVPIKMSSSTRRVGRPKGSGNRPKAHASIGDSLLSNGRYFTHIFGICLFLYRTKLISGVADDVV